MSKQPSTLPTRWAVSTIEEVTQPRVEQREPRADRAVPYIDISSINRKSKKISGTRYVDASTAPTRARQWVRTGDVLVSMTRPNLNAVAQVSESLSGAVASTGFDVLRAIGILPSWLYYRAQSNAFVSDMCKDVQGVVYPAVRPRDVRAHELPIPPLCEQERIIQTLDSSFTRIEAVAAALERIQLNLKRYRASVLKGAVEGRLVPSEAQLAREGGGDYEPAQVFLNRILAERRRLWERAELMRLKTNGEPPIGHRRRHRYRQPLAPKPADLSPLPEGWCWATLDQLSWDSSYGTSTKCKYDGVGEPVLRIPNIADGSLTFNDIKSAVKPLGTRGSDGLAPGDLLVIRTNGSRSLIARAALVREHLPSVHFFASYLIRFRLVLGSEIGSWLLTFWHSTPTRKELEAKAATSAGQYNVSQRALLQTAVPLPPLLELSRIQHEVDRLFSMVTQANGVIDSAVIRCNRLRESTLAWAFDGKLVDQDPNDEPASVLLERIRTEREAAYQLQAGQRRNSRTGRRGRGTRQGGRRS